MTETKLSKAAFLLPCAGCGKLNRVDLEFKYREATKAEKEEKEPKKGGVVNAKTDDKERKRRSND